MFVSRTRNSGMPCSSPLFGSWQKTSSATICTISVTDRSRGRQEQMTSAAQYLEGQTDILKAFDPDFLPNFSADPLPQELKEFQRRAFAAERLPNQRHVSARSGQRFIRKQQDSSGKERRR
jgi:hypothetical protein